MLGNSLTLCVVYKLRINIKLLGTSEDSIMGNDGGSIPTRRELVKSPTRKATHSQLRDSNAQAQEYHWSICPLSKQLLISPVVSDSSGRLYNKDSILEWLLHGIEAFGDGEEVLEGRVRSLRDVLEVKFEILKGEGEKKEKWVCPISRKELGPGVRSVYLVPCGHAFSECAVKEVGSDGVCLQCNTPYEPENAVLINPITTIDVERLQIRANGLTEKGLGHTLKRLSNDTSKKRKKEKKDGGERLSKDITGIKNVSTANRTNEVLGDTKMKMKRRKVEMNDNLKSLFSTKGEGERLGKNDFMSRGYTIPSKR